VPRLVGLTRPEIVVWSVTEEPTVAGLADRVVVMTGEPFDALVVDFVVVELVVVDVVLVLDELVVVVDLVVVDVVVVELVVLLDVTVRISQALVAPLLLASPEYMALKL
jgi:hypothetical protein